MRHVVTNAFPEIGQVTGGRREILVVMEHREIMVL